MFTKDSRKAENGGAGKGLAPSIMGAGLRIVGDLRCEADMQIDGVVEGNVTSESLTVGENGIVQGKVVAQRLHVAGTVTGEIRASEVLLAKTARVTGDVLHHSLAIEPGARLDGHCRRLEDAGTGTPERDVSTVSLVVRKGGDSA
ncbi:MAG: bactofilin family protein [Alphaproteobacteria bacterium]